jgi:hypothetical protein
LPRLRQGVPLEGVFVLEELRRGRDLVDGDGLKVQAGLVEQDGDLAHLVPVAGGDDELHGLAPANACFCRANSSAAPLRASATSRP